MAPPLKALLASVALAGLSGFLPAGADGERDPDPGLSAAKYTVTDLGTFGGPSSEPLGINNAGQIVGHADLAPDAGGTVYHHAFLYENGVMTDLGTIGPGCDPGNSAAFDINETGRIVGETCASGTYPRAFAWSNGEMVDLGALGGTTSSASGINNAGDVVGTAGPSAFLYRGGLMQDLWIPGCGLGAGARHINDLGRIVGHCDLTPHTSWAFVYVAPGQMGVLYLAQGDAWRINAAGKVVGRTVSTGFLYSQGVMTYIRGLGPGFTVASSINNYDQIVGQSEVGPIHPHAFLYRNGVTVDLNSQIPDYPDWELVTASAINDAGQVVGKGTVGGNWRGFLLTPVPIAPAAVNDTYATGFQTTLTVPAPGVLANDDCSGNCAMHAEVETGAVHGTLTLQPNGGFTYTPAAGYAGPDAFSYRAVNDGGSSNLATVSLTVAQPTSVQPPATLYTYSIAGNVVTLRWAPPVAGPSPTGYVVEGGINPGEVLAAFPTGSAYPIYTFVAPAGSFHVRVHSLAGADQSAPSNEIRLHVGVPVGPSPPAGLTSAVNGSAVNLAWRNTFEGGATSAVYLEVQTGPTTSILPLGLTETFAAGGVPPGAHTARLWAVNAGGVSGPSNSVVVTVPSLCSGSPELPANSLAYAIGRTVFVVWDPPVTGPAASAYDVLVSGTVAGRFQTFGRAMSGTVGPGTYELSVVAANACGSGPATPTQTITIR